MSIVALFPGQGAQHLGMGKALLENFRQARVIFEEASDAARLALRKLCIDGPESDLALTENTQPALLTVSVAAYRVAREELGFRPAAVAGHSLGEYSALVAAGALQLAPAVAWVRERGRAMQQAVPVGEGTMAAVMGMEDLSVEALCAAARDEARARRKDGREARAFTVDAVVEPANFNSPGQIVVAGSVDAVAIVLELLKAGDPRFAGGKAIPLDVSAPFHCRLMKPARERMERLFSDAPAGNRPDKLQCPYVPNRTAKLSMDESRVFALLSEQVDHPVLWRQSAVHLMHGGFQKAVEFGPGKVLQGLMKRIAKAEKVEMSLVGMGDKDSFDALTPWLKENMK
ncbi:MAG: ACP S-malonyltransferase [Bdellovibrionales bacterium]|nr:ACP S-malonyltransferase [Bdellovibrionales bacterium]